MLKVLTLNTWNESANWKKRWEMILEFIKNEQPDILFFQELFNQSWAKYLRE